MSQEQDTIWKLRHTIAFMQKHIDKLRDLVAELDKAAVDEMAAKERYANECERLKEEMEALTKEDA